MSNPADRRTIRDTPESTTNSGRHTRSDRCLNGWIPALLQQCDSRDQVFGTILEAATGIYSASAALVTDLNSPAELTHRWHDPRMARSLAERFCTEYLEPFAWSTISSGDLSPRLKRYERGEQQMTLICAPIHDGNSGTTQAAVTIMLGGGDHRPETLLPQLDAIASVASVSLARIGTKSDTHSDSASAVQQVESLIRAAEFGSVREFGYAIVNSLRAALQAEQVALGTINSGRIHVEAVSDFADFKPASPGLVAIQQAMEECYDYGSEVVAQASVNLGPAIHRRWSTQTGDSCICSLPLHHRGQSVAVVTVRRPARLPFQPDDVEKLKEKLNGYGPAVVLLEKAGRSSITHLRDAVKQQVRRLTASGYRFRLILACLILVVSGWFFFGSMTYRPICRSRVTCANLTHLSAPINGQLREVAAEPGQKVHEGQILASFDTTELELELASLIRQSSATEVELRHAISQEDLAAAALARSRIHVLKAQTAAVQRKIEQAQLRAPFDGVVIQADLQQRIGQVFSRGEDLLQVAGDGAWMLEIEIPDGIAHCVMPQQSGSFAATSRPDESQTFIIRNVDGAAVTVADRNVFLARAPLDTKPDWMKSGMEGMARITTVSRPVWWVVMHRAVDWLRMNVWL